MSKHTPGPWKAERTGAGRLLRIYPHGDEQPSVCGAILNYSAVACEANAHLIAAAPELLAALEQCLHLAEREMIRNQSTEFDTGSTKRYEQARAAIAKAKGETP